MKVLLISNDESIKSIIEKICTNDAVELELNDTNSNSLDVLSQICIYRPTLLILDDDFITPHSSHLLSAMKKAHPKIMTIFITSNFSIEFGREINTIGVNHYIIKPVSLEIFYEYFNSVKNINSIKTY